MREKAFSAAIWVFDNTPESKLGKFKGNQYENIVSCNHLTSVPIYARRDDRFAKRINNDLLIIMIIQGRPICYISQKYK